MVLAVLDGEPMTLAGCPGRGCPSNEEARAAATARPSTVKGGCGRPLRPGGASLGARDAAPRRRRWIAALVTRAAGCDASPALAGARSTALVCI
jgi:hypothetical protein